MDGIEHSRTIKLHTAGDFAGMRAAGRIAAAALDMIAFHVREGITTAELDHLCRQFLLDHGATPASLGCRGYTRATCISLDHVVCHGIPGERRLAEGDILNIDRAAILDGWHGASSRMYAAGRIGMRASRLMDVVHQAMMRGIEAIRPGATIGDIGFAIQQTVEAARFSVARDFCGHGLGRVHHDAPNVLNHGRPGQGPRLQPGTCLTVEPMVNAGRPGVKVLSDGWTAVTRDRSLSAQLEHSVGVTGMATKSSRSRRSPALQFQPTAEPTKDVAPMPSTSPDQAASTILIIGASRGLGHAMAAEFLKKNWRVVGTVRAGTGRTKLHELAEASEDRLEIETLDINEPEQIAALQGRLSGCLFDILFVNAGTTTQDEHVKLGEVTTGEFMRVMVTNALSPMRVIEAFQDTVPATGMIGVMSSGQGSITNNETGMREVYRGSKAALNMFMRSFAARPSSASRALVLMAPGWVRTDLGGPDAPFSIEGNVPKLVDVLLSRLGTRGVQYLDYLGRTVPW